MASEGQSFARKLRHNREAAELSQEALAERAGMSTRGIADLEGGLTRAPRLHMLSRHSEALGLDPTDRQDLLRTSGGLSSTEPVPDTPPPQAPSPSLGGLPVYQTPVFGREREEAALSSLLRRDWRSPFR
jgi:transcriptional regulator with XRE-family HTH domain